MYLATIALFAALITVSTTTPPPQLARELAPRLPAPVQVAWSAGHKTSTDWASIIDDTWGPGEPAANQLAVFNGFWNHVDRYFACFHDIEDNWDDLQSLYLPEVTGGVSRGRFAGILGQLGLSLRESHTSVYDDLVHGTFAGRGVPLLETTALGYRAGTLGAAVTALDDGRGLVYRVHADNPLGLACGDVILGYDGRPWLDCLAELLDAELPVVGMWGSSPQSWDHHWASAVGANWHLFETMDVIEYATGDTIHLATTAIDGYQHALYASDQLDVGIPFPDVSQQQTVTWGVIDRGGQEIGYVYVFGWAYSAGDDFYAALDDLTTNHNTAGLIIDFRKNYGGNMFLSDAGLGLLFASQAVTIEWFERCSILEHLPLCDQGAWPYYVISPQPAGRHYDNPIAVLTGPGAVSSGDQVALRLTYHPEARVFGKSTAAAFNAPDFYDLAPDYHGATAVVDCARMDAYDEPLTHLDFPVDVPVWLTPDDVAQGIDTVVEAAADWITGGVTAVAPAAETVPAPTAHFLGAHPNPFNPTTELVIRLTQPSNGRLTIYDLSGRRVREFPLDGLSAGDHRIRWDGRSDSGRAQASGSYVVRLQVGGDASEGRITLVR